MPLLNGAKNHFKCIEENPLFLSVIMTVGLFFIEAGKFEIYYGIIILL